MTNKQKPTKMTKMLWDVAWPYFATHPIAGAITLNTARRVESANKKLEQLFLQDDVIDKGTNEDERFANGCIHYYEKSILEQDANPLNLVKGVLLGYCAQLIATPLITYSLTGNYRATIVSLAAQVGATIATGYSAYRRIEQIPLEEE